MKTNQPFEKSRLSKERPWLVKKRAGINPSDIIDESRGYLQDLVMDE